ncbi:MAG: hypothetical protein C0404_07400 [Verrucomicrobia bacterium]|nr:hypothetical protein [Verrucomicrobiota bacterium]
MELKVTVAAERWIVPACILALLCVPVSTGYAAEEDDEDDEDVAEVAVTNRRPTVVVPTDQHKETARLLAKMLPRRHLFGKAMDDAVSRAAWRNYISFLDPERMYFLSTDIEEFRRHEDSIDDEIAKGDLSFAFDVFARAKERIRDRSEYALKLLCGDINLEMEGTYQSNRKDATWVADRKEWDELWLKHVTSEYVGHLVAEPRTNANARVGTNIASRLDPKAAAASELNRYYNRVKTVIDAYDADWVAEEFFLAVTHTYDPHTDYMSPASFDDFSADMKLSTAGVGVWLRMDDRGVVRISKLMPGGPAEKDGRLSVGDRIQAIAAEGEPDVSITDLPMRRITKLLRGKKGSKVTIVAAPESDPSGLTVLRVEIVRDEIKLEDQAAKSEVKDVQRDDKPVRCGIIKLPAFYGGMATKPGETKARSSSRDMMKILAGFRGTNVAGVLIDLRNNGGGSLGEAIKMTGLFIEKGPVVQIKMGRGVSLGGDNDRHIEYSGPLLVLVNRGTASSSEILAGALQDYGRAIVAGDSKTFGKGSVQEVVKIGEEEKLGRLKITDALYYRISGSSTQLKGVTSDLTIPSVSESVESGEDYMVDPLEWTMVRPAGFKAFGTLQPLVQKLEVLMEKRRNGSVRFRDYTNLLSRVDALRKLEEWPLAKSKRQVLAAEQKLATELRNKLIGKEDKKTDIVLDEALEMLVDLVQVWNIRLKDFPRDADDAEEDEETNPGAE